MLYEIWYDRGCGDTKARPEFPFSTWQLYRPLPRNSQGVAAAVAEIIDKKQFILITISRSLPAEKKETL